MFHIIYQHSWEFNLETLQMTTQLKMLSTIQQYSKQVNLISTYHNFIFLILKSKLQDSCE
jgi:hypothetical protein